MPRYSVKQILRWSRYLCCLSDLQLSAIPRLPNDMKALLLREDINRAALEPGTHVLHLSGGTIPAPKVVFPVDTFIQHYFDSAVDILRLRGGDDDDYEMEEANDLPVDSSQQLNTTHDMDARPLLPPFPSDQKRRLRHTKPDQCSICDLGCERVLLKVSDQTNDESAPNGTESYSGIGCSVSFLEICVDASFKLCEYDGDNVAKKSLLQLAERIPRMFRVSSDRDLTPKNQLTRDLFWSNFDTWREFVIDSWKFESLCQAYVLLLVSIKQDILPEWWKSDCGWFSVQTALHLQSTSAFMLHLHLLDAALSEAVAVEENRPMKIPSLYLLVEDENFVKLVDQAVHLAKKAVWKKKRKDKDDYNTDCFVCQDGGDMLCCEFCTNVCHLSCCRPVIESEPEEFVCLSCLMDLQVWKHIPSHGGTV